MQKYAVLYAKYAWVSRVYILHILHLYALPTLLMSLSGTTEVAKPWRLVGGRCPGRGRLHASLAMFNIVQKYTPARGLLCRAHQLMPGPEIRSQTRPEKKRIVTTWAPGPNMRKCYNNNWIWWRGPKHFWPTRAKYRRQSRNEWVQKVWFTRHDCLLLYH